MYAIDIYIYTQSIIRTFQNIYLLIKIVTRIYGRIHRFFQTSGYSSSNENFIKFFPIAITEIEYHTDQLINQLIAYLCGRNSLFRRVSSVCRLYLKRKKSIQNMIVEN